MPPVENALTYVGHATLLAELAGERLLTDPLLGDVLHVRRRVPAPVIEDLRSLGAVLISHAHYDHLDGRSLRTVADACPVIVPRGCAHIARRLGATDVVELREGDCLQVGEVWVEAVPAAHDGRRYPVGPRTPALGYLLIGPSRVYFAGDTDLFSGMSALAGRVDVAALPVWGWGRRVPSGHLDPARAAQAVARIRPAVAVPIHWGTLRALGTQRAYDPAEPARAFAEAVGRVDSDTEVRILWPGQRTVLPEHRELS
jgi:L-ascorbate metabolism protein UlaG (beta-lactamase superfamily)